MKKQNPKMNEKELRFILQEGEGQSIEFKESINGIDKDMVAFANSNKGRILLGVDDKSMVKTGKVTNRLKSDVQNIARNCDPSIEIRLEKFEDVLIIEVEEGKDKPYRCKEGFYIRMGANSQKMSRDEIIALVMNEGKIRFDELINKEFNFKKDFDGKKLKDYSRRANLSEIIPLEKILLELDVAGKDKNLNNAGVLFFAKEPQKFISHSVFTCLLFRDKEGSDIIDRQEIKGSLIEIVEGVIKFIEKNTRVAYRFTGKPPRENVYEYPLEAIREAVINSVMHRDYFEKGHNNLLRIFPGNLTITNVWHRPSWFKPGKDTFRRNKVIANLFSRIGWIEKIGSGFARMKRFCRMVRAPVFKLDLDEKYFRIIFFKSRDYLELAERPAEKLGEKVGEKEGKKVGEKGGVRLTENQKKILEMIGADRYITFKELSEKIKISEKNVYFNIKKLKKKNLLKRIGPAKGGCWEVAEK